MDAMALLCMLHADGPATLKNLRQAGCTSLEAIEAMDEERLSKLLRASAAAARRFAREARHLRERLGQGLLDREETALVDHGMPSRPAAAIPEPGADGRERSWPGQDVVEEALAAWRARDLAELESESTAGEPTAAEEGAAAMELTEALSEVEEPPEPAEPAGEIVAAPPALAADEIDGLDAERSRLLAEAGVRTLEDLALADALELSRSSGLAYTDVWRLTGLARRSVSAAPRTSILREIRSAEPISSKVSPSEQPLHEEPSILELEWNREIRPAPPPPRPPPADVPAVRPQREGAGGPFA